MTSYGRERVLTFPISVGTPEACGAGESVGATVGISIGASLKPPSRCCTNANEKSGQQTAVLIVEDRADFERAGRLVDLRGRVVHVASVRKAFLAL